MAPFKILKLSPTLVRFLDGALLYSGSRYAVWCEAPEFASDVESACTLELEGAAASCTLAPDPLRRGVRTGTLSLADVDAGRKWLCAKLDGDVLFRAEVVVFAPASAQDAPVSGRWTVVDGTLQDGQLAVADMSQVRLSASPAQAPLALSVSDDPFEAYVVVTSSSPGFPFTGVTVNGNAPVWTRQDSLALPSTRWVLHVMKVAGVFQAELHAGIPAGTETDPDGDLVTSVEVNDVA